MRNSSGRTDILSTFLQEVQKPVMKNLMKWKSSVLSALFVAFSPFTVKATRNIFSTRCSQQFAERETSQGEPAPSAVLSRVSAHRSAQTAGLVKRSKHIQLLFQGSLFHNARSVQHPTMGKDLIHCRKLEEWPFKCSPRGL